MEEPCVIRVVRCSGTIRKAEEEAVRRAREFIVKARQQGNGVVDLLEKGGNGKEVVVERDVMDIVSESDEDG
jgi:ribonuclease P/MRP protein subunit POP5